MALNPFEQLQILQVDPYQAFEEIAASILRAVIPGSRRVRVYQGDGGVDVFHGTYGGEGAIEVYQIKYFPGPFNDSRKRQIKESYATAKNSPDYKLKKWILCVPVRLTKNDLRWFDEWRDQESVVIELLDGDDLTDYLEKDECAGVRDKLRSWGVTGIQTTGVRFGAGMYAQKGNARSSGFTYTLVVHLHNEGGLTARNVVIEVGHDETHCVGMAASTVLWMDESGNAAANPKRLRARQSINPNERVTVLGIPMIAETPFPFSVGLKVSAEDTPMLSMLGTITAEQAERGEAVQMRQGPTTVYRSTPEPAKKARSQPTSQAAKELLEYILKNEDANSRGITVILEGDPGNSLNAAYLFTTAEFGQSGVYNMRMRVFQAGMDELLRLGWLHDPVEDHATAIYDFNPE